MSVVDVPERVEIRPAPWVHRAADAAAPRRKSSSGTAPSAAVTCLAPLAALPRRSDAIDLDAVAEIVRAAALLAPEQRHRHIAFVGVLAFGGVAASRQSSAADTIATLTRAAQQVAVEATRGIWEDWEAEYLVGACAAIAGRLRSELPAAGNRQDLPASLPPRTDATVLAAIPA